MDHARLNSKPVFQTAAFILLLSLTAAIYFTGHDSRFLLDDFYNLQNLDLVADYGYGSYVFTSGIAGPAGRPLSLLTFALQYDSWPSDPAAFKLVNISLHLVNGVLVFILCKLLTALVCQAAQRRFMWSMVVTTLWLLHPIQISTTLYVVQRMTQLSALFTLLGAIAYLHYRFRLQHVNSAYRLLMLSLVFAACLVGAVLSKENGILLPLHLLVVEATLLVDVVQKRNLRLWRSVFLGIPLFVLVVYLIMHFKEVSGSFQTRGYTMTQKLMTEGLVVTDYIKNILLPRPSVFGLYHDDFPIAAGLFSPPSVFLAVIFLFGLLVLALKVRKNIPVLSFSILWFLGGHLLESTYLNIEPYFEHRNYLPSFGLFFAIGWLVARMNELLSRKWIVYSAVTLYCGLIIAVTWMEIGIWARPDVQAVEWARRHPRSERALYDLLQYHSTKRDYENAGQVLLRLEEIAPHKVYPQLLKVVLHECQAGRTLADADWDRIITRTEAAQPDGLITIALLDRLVLDVIRGSCPGLDTVKLTVLISQLLKNSGFSDTRAYQYEYLSALSSYKGDHRQALELIRQALDLEFAVSRKIREFNLLRQLGETQQLQTCREELLESVRNDYRLRLGYGRMLESII